MKQLTKEEFKQKLESGEKFIVDFYATWCGPCKMMMPIVENVSNKLTNTDMTIYKYDIDQGMDLALELGIRGVPTIKAFTGGKEVFSKAGIMREDEIMNVANSVLHG